MWEGGRCACISWEAGLMMFEELWWRFVVVQWRFVVVWWRFGVVWGGFGVSRSAVSPDYRTIQ